MKRIFFEHIRKVGRGGATMCPKIRYKKAVKVKPRESMENTQEQFLLMSVNVMCFGRLKDCEHVRKHFCFTPFFNLCI